MTKTFYNNEVVSFVGTPANLKTFKFPTNMNNFDSFIISTIRISQLCYLLISVVHTICIAITQTHLLYPFQHHFINYLLPIMYPQHPQHLIWK